MENVVKRLNKKPAIGKNVFIAQNSVVTGDVELGDNVSIWFNVVIRGDVDFIKIGNNSNIQDGSVIHVTKDRYPCKIGQNVTIAHNVTLHGCTIEDFCLIGIGAVVLDNTVIQKNSIVAAGSVVPPNKTFPPNSLIMGNPAKVSRSMTEADTDIIIKNIDRYLKYKDIYLEMGF